MSARDAYLAVISKNLEDSVAVVSDTVHQILIRGERLQSSLDKTKQLYERSERFQHVIEEAAGSRTLWKRSKRAVSSSIRAVGAFTRQTVEFLVFVLFVFWGGVKTRTLRLANVLFPMKGFVSHPREPYAFFVVDTEDEEWDEEEEGYHSSLEKYA